MNKYKVLIIGAGSIGALKDNQFDSPESNQIYTHAHACYLHPLIDLVGIMDTNVEKAYKASVKWNTINYATIPFTFKYKLDETPDIVIVATNTDTHYDIIHQLIPYKPKVIICEKPFCTSYEQAKNIGELCEQTGIKLVVNYQREFVPELKQLSKDLKAGAYGDIYNFTLRYSRGLLREASHAFFWCLNTFSEVEFLSKEKYYDDSPIPGDYSSWVNFNTNICPSISFIPIGPAYSTYNADIYTGKGRIELLNNWKTIRFHEFTKSTYGDYKATGLLFEDKTTQLDQALTFLLDHVINIINDKANDNWRQALEVHKYLKLEV